MKITFDEEDAIVVARALAKSRGLKIDFKSAYMPDSTEDRIYTEALRVVAALKAKAES